MTNAGAELIELKMFEDRRRARAASGGAEILIFTGVRYERMSEDHVVDRRVQEAR